MNISTNPKLLAACQFVIIRKSSIVPIALGNTYRKTLIDLYIGYILLKWFKMEIKTVFKVIFT